MSKTYRACVTGPDDCDEEDHRSAPTGRDPATAEARELKRGRTPVTNRKPTHKPNPN